MAQTDIVLEVIDDLKKKIDELKNVGNGIDGESATKINEIKQKAIKHICIFIIIFLKFILF